MIRMRKMHLINWHNFVDDQIDFQNMTYFIGLNAVGKTTIMDAIRYCLTTNKDFNTAGNKKSGRSLQGSVHQKQRAEDTYLRPNHTVAYIGIEFLDESIKKTFVIVVRIESESPKQDLRHVYQDWYISKTGYSLADMPFFAQTKAGRRPASREEFKLDNRGMDKAPSQAEARRRISRVLGIGDADSPLGKKFNEVFHMGTSLEDIHDIRKFIYTYILPEPEVNVDVLHQDMRELERLQEALEEVQQKEKLLVQINQELLMAKEHEAKIKVNQVLVTYARWQEKVERQSEEQHKILQAKTQIAGYEDRLNQLQKKKDETSRKLYMAQKEMDDNQENKSLAYLEEEEKSKQEEYGVLVKKAATFTSLYQEMAGLLKKMASFDMGAGLDVSMLGDKEAGFEDKQMVIQACQKYFWDAGEAIKEKDAEIRNKIRGLKAEIEELTRKISKLESGKMYYPKEADLVKEAINQKLREGGREEVAKLFCELLYMKDKQWQDAVESYLNTQRFHIIVPPEAYASAKEVFVGLEDRVRGIGLIDSVRLMKQREDIQVAEGALAGTLESQNPYARAYADYLMGRVICCQSKVDLEQYPKSVSKDRLKYQGYSLQRMKKQDNYIGIDAIQEQLEKARQALKEKRQEEQNLEEEKRRHDDLDQACRKFVSGPAFKDLAEFCGAEKEAAGLAQEIGEITKRIEEFKQNPILIAMYNRVEECKQEDKKLEAQIIDTKSAKMNREDIIQRANRAIAGLQVALVEAEKEYKAILETHALFIDQGIKKYDQEKKSKKAYEIANNFQSSIVQLQNKLDAYLNSHVLPLQREYNGKYTCDYPEGLGGIDKYQEALNLLVNIALEEHRASLSKAQIRCKERFRKEILFRMKDDILRAKRQFRDLNKVMDHLTYGEESYRFVIEGNKDKELNIFYNIIMDKDNQQIDQDNPILEMLALQNQSQVLESQIEEFMQRIMVDVESHAQEVLTGKKNGAKNISTYVDYRTYLDYDIIVKNMVTKLEVALSKVSGDGSGGENQAPFYVAICASLLQIYQQSDNCIRLVLLDEAFNNMTSDRIEPMMKMFRDLKLQLVLIATPEKCTSIQPYCDITYSIVKHGSRNAIRGFEGV